MLIDSNFKEKTLSYQSAIYKFYKQHPANQHVTWLFVTSRRTFLYLFGYILGLRILKMPYCAVWGCKSNSMVDKSISFFGFPTDLQRLKIWVHYYQRQCISPSKHSKACSKHFTSRQYSRNPAWLSYVPLPFVSSCGLTVFLVYDSYLSMTDNSDTHVEVVLVQSTVVHVKSGNENDHLCNRPITPPFSSVWCLVTQDLSSKFIYCIYMFNTLHRKTTNLSFYIYIRSGNWV